MQQHHAAWHGAWRGQGPAHGPSPRRQPRDSALGAYAEMTLLNKAHGAAGPSGKGRMEPASLLATPQGSPGGSPRSSETVPCKTTLKVVAVGDDLTGKTALLRAYAEGGFSADSYFPTVYDELEREAQLPDGRPVLVLLCDTAGQEEYAHLRPKCYASADVVLVCFSLCSEQSWHSLPAWVQESRTYAPDATIIVVGTKADQLGSGHSTLRHDEDERRGEAHKIGASHYFETSSLQGLNINKVFDAALAARPRTALLCDLPALIADAKPADKPACCIVM
jgi:small GTP-binding protein